MSNTTRIFAAVTAVAAITAAGAYAFAQQGPEPGMMGMGRGMMGHGMGMGPGMGPAMRNAGDPAGRLDAIKTEIGIKADQSAAWDAYARIVTEVAAGQRAHRESVDRDAMRNMEPKDRQAMRDSMRSERDAASGKVKAASEALLAKLDETQKEKARRSLPGLVAWGPGEGMRHGMMGGRGMEHGMGGEGMGPRFQR